MNAKKRRNYIPWTKEEDDLLRQLSEAGANFAEAQEVFPYRGDYSVKNRATHLGLSFAGKVFTPDQSKFEEVMARLTRPDTQSSGKTLKLHRG